LATAVRVGGLGVVAAGWGGVSAPFGVFGVVLDPGQPAGPGRGFPFPLNDPFLPGAPAGADGGLGLPWGRASQTGRDRRLRDHTRYYELAVQRVRPGNGSVCPKAPKRGRQTA